MIAVWKGGANVGTVLRKRNTNWVLLHRSEDGNSVYIYEPLRKKQVSVYERHGWEVVK